MTKDNNNTDQIGWGIPIGVAVFVLAALISTWFFLGKDLTNRGTFGDMFGAVNAMFSGLAFGGVVFAILLQRKELILQRQELKFTRNELEGQKIQLEAQNKTLQKQNFENTFFELLRLQNEITQQIDLVDNSNKITKGRDCFQVFYTRFTKSWNKAHPDHQGKHQIDRINKTYLAFYQAYQSEFGHYFRSLYNLIKFVDNSYVEDKRLYTNLVRAHLSSYELALLFYNALSDMGREKFKPLIEKYSLLKTVPKAELISPQDHTDLYDRSAYGNE